MVSVSMGSGNGAELFPPLSPQSSTNTLKLGAFWALAGARKPQILVTWDPELGSVAHWLGGLGEAPGLSLAALSVKLAHRAVLRVNKLMPGQHSTHDQGWVNTSYY